MNNCEGIKKVLFVATVDSHIINFHLPYLKMLKENGYEVHVCTGENGKIPYCDKKIKISIHRNPYKIENIKAIRQLKKVIDNENYSIIHCHTPMGGVITRLSAKKTRTKGTRVIYTAHGFHFYKGAPMINWLFYYPIEKYLSKYTDTLITINNEDFARAKKKFSKRCNNIEYIPGVGVDDSKFNIEMTEDEKNLYRKSLGLKKDDFIMTCIGRLDKNKNQILLIKSMKELVKKYNRIHLLLIGPDELRGHYKKETKKNGLEEKIHFLGLRTDIPKLLKISNIYLSSSKREGLPISIIEAMYCGLPIIATNCRGNSDLISDYKNGHLIDLKCKNVVSEFINSILKVKNNILKSEADFSQFTLEATKKMYYKIYFNQGM